MAEIYVIPGIEGPDIGSQVTPRTVLEAAIESGVQDVVIVGRYPSGALYLAASEYSADAVVGKLFRAAQFLAEREVVQERDDGA